MEACTHVLPSAMACKNLTKQNQTNCGTKFDIPKIVHRSECTWVETLKGGDTSGRVLLSREVMFQRQGEQGAVEMRGEMAAASIRSSRRFSHQHCCQIQRSWLGGAHAAAGQCQQNIQILLQAINFHSEMGISVVVPSSRLETEKPNAAAAAHSTAEGTGSKRSADAASGRSRRKRAASWRCWQESRHLGDAIAWGWR